MKYRASLLPCAAAAAALVSLGALGACSESTPDPLVTPDGGGGEGGGAGLTPTATCADAVDAIYADPGAVPADPASRGNVLKCATDPVVTKDAMQAKLTELGYVGKPLTSNAKVYRVSYVTQRGNAAGTPAVSSAAVYIPETPRADKLPVVIAARGSRGQAPSCAVSKLDPSQAGINGDAFRLVYPLVGQGYAVILTDLAGYANFGGANNPPSAYAQAEDVARSTLDSGRALKKLFPALDDKVVLVGHSQGGHSALAALANADTYGTAGPIVGAAVYAPLWLSQRSWGAILYSSVGNAFPFDKSSAGAVSIWYHYTHAELLDGPGEGKKLFKADKADAIEKFVKETCWEDKTAALTPLGTYASDVFDQNFINALAFPATFGNPCEGANATVCQRWIDRYS